eukprot:s362_g5.t1
MAVAWADAAEPQSDHDLGPWPLQPGPLAGNAPICAPVHIKGQRQAKMSPKQPKVIAGKIESDNSNKIRAEARLAGEVLTVAAEALREYPDPRVRSLKDLEEVQQLRLVIGSPAKSGESDPDGVGLIDWQLAIYSGAGGVDTALNFIHYILEYKIRKGYVTRMPELAARVFFPEAVTLPLPWQELKDESIVLPKPFAALPPKGRRHVLAQLDPKEPESDQTGEGSDGLGPAAYQLTFYGGIYHFKERFENLRVPGTLLPTSNPAKRDYVRYVDIGLANAAAEQRILAVLNSVLLGLPVFFVNSIGSDDPMALWLLQQPSVIEGECQQAAAAPTTPAPSAPSVVASPPAADEAVASSSDSIAEEWEPEEDIDQPVAADMTLRVLLRYLKRHHTRLSTKFKYGFLEKDAVESILPDPSAFRSKRSWERAMHHARILLRNMADNFDTGSSNAADPGKTVFQA